MGSFFFFDGACLKLLKFRFGGEEASACNDRRHRLGIEHTWRLFRVCFRDFYHVFDKGLCEGSTKGR